MKSLLLPLLAAFVSLPAVSTRAEEPAAPALEAGAAISPAALSQIDWIRGEAPAEWEPGAVYLIECWATWCGPCIAAIPKLNELHLNFKDKGLRIIGVNVWEDGIDKVREFVTSRGHGMAYPIAYTGRGGAFETEWLVPAGVRGIPHAFVVRDGKLLIKTHPSYLTEEVVTGLLAGGEAADAALAGIDQLLRQREEIGLALRAFSQAANAGNLPAMEEAYARAEAAGADPLMTRQHRAELAIARKDWADLSAVIELSTDGGPNNQMTLQTILRRFDANDEISADLIRQALAAYEPRLGTVFGPVEFHTLANLEWRVGNKERALVRIRQAVERAADERNARVGVPADFYRRIADAFESGEPPSRETVGEWLREALESRKEAAKPADS
jgi:thiol-disulfide isomerase/thioredoxin